MCWEDELIVFELDISEIYNELRFANFQIKYKSYSFEPNSLQTTSLLITLPIIISYRLATKKWS